MITEQTRCRQRRDARCSSAIAVDVSRPGVSDLERWAFPMRVMLAILTTLVAPATWATIQMPDIVRIANREYQLSFYIRSNAFLSIYDCQAPKVPWLPMPHTACARGYVGVWEVRDRQLFLVDLRETVDDQGALTTNRFPELFPSHLDGLPARWFTGLLRLNEPKSDGYMPDAHDYVYAQELHLEVVEGMVKSSRFVDNTALVREVRRRAIERMEAERESRKSKAQQDGPANQSQPVGPATNQTSPAAGSGG